MKKVFLLGAMVCALGMMTANVSAQNVTDSDIVGKWEFKEAQNFRSPNAGMYRRGELAVVAGETVFSLMRDIEFRPDGTLSVQVAVDRDPDGNYMFSTYEAKWSIGKDVRGVAEITITTEDATIVCQLQLHEDKMTITPPAVETFLSFKYPKGISSTVYFYHRKK